MSVTVPVRAVIPPPALPRRSSSPFSSFRAQILPRAPYEPSISYSPSTSLSRPSHSHHLTHSHPAHAPLQHDVKGIHVSSPTQCPTPTSSLSPYGRYDVSPIIAPRPHPSYTLPSIVGRPPALPIPHQYYQTQPLTQAPVHPPTATLWRPSAAPYPATSSRSSSAYDFERSRSLSSSSVSYRPVSRSASTRGPHYPTVERIEEHPVPTPVQPSLATPQAAPAAPQSQQQQVVATDAAWSVYFLSLPASPVFLHRLSLSLMAWHTSLLLVSLVLFLVVALTTSAFADLLSVYLLFYAAKSLVSLSMVVYRYRHADCWQYEDPILATVRSQRFHVLDHAVRCVGVAAAGVVSWLLFSGMTGGLGSVVGKVVLALLCVEYAGVALPVLCNLGLSFFVPCIHLSFYLPYLPFPSLSAAAVHVEEDKAGMTEDDLSTLPMSRYRASKRGEDATCAVCLAEVEEDEEVRVLSCRHMYHRDCIDSWLRKRGVCPLCVRKVSVHKGGKAAGQKEEVKIEMVATPTAQSPVTTTETGVEVQVEVVQQVDATYAGRVEVDAVAGTEELRRVA